MLIKLSILETGLYTVSEYGLTLKNSKKVVEGFRTPDLTYENIGKLYLKMEFERINKRFGLY